MTLPDEQIGSYATPGLAIIMSEAATDYRVWHCTHFVLFPADGIEQPIHDREPGTNVDQLPPDAVEHVPLL